MVYYAFDLLHLDGFDIRAAPLIERKRLLQSFLSEAAGPTAPRILYSEHFENGPNLYARAADMGLKALYRSALTLLTTLVGANSGSRSSAGNASAS